MSLPRTQIATTLLLSSMALPASPKLAVAARDRKWAVACLNPRLRLPNTSIVFYGSTLEARVVAKRYRLALLEPPLDLLARIPPSLLLRRVQFCRWEEIGTLGGPTFLKPADPLDKVFDAGVYRERSQIRVPRPNPPETPVLASEPVEWLAEYRCFVLEGKVAAVSPYLSFGRPLHHGDAVATQVPAPVLDVCRRLASIDSPAQPPAYVIDVGLIENRGWAVVEFNPAWCSGLLSADPEKVLDVLQRSCRLRRQLTASDHQWVSKR